MAGEKPKVRLHVELGPDQALAVLAALFRDLGNAVEHQHGRQRQLGALDEQLPPTAGQEVLEFELIAAGLHPGPLKIWKWPVAKAALGRYLT